MSPSPVTVTLNICVGVGGWVGGGCGQIINKSDGTLGENWLNTKGGHTKY